MRTNRLSSPPTLGSHPICLMAIVPGRWFGGSGTNLASIGLFFFLRRPLIGLRGMVKTVDNYVQKLVEGDMKRELSDASSRNESSAVTCSFLIDRECRNWRFNETVHFSSTEIRNDRSHCAVGGERITLQLRSTQATNHDRN